MERKNYMINGHSVSLETASDIKWYHLEKNPDSHFFDRKTMRFFGDTMNNFGVYWDEENGYRCIYRKKPVKNGLRGGFRLREDGVLMPTRR